MRHSKRNQFDASRWFFPLAAGYGAVIPLLSVLSLTGRLSCFKGLSTPLGHAHEMLFGFAMAIVAGFLQRRVRGPHLLVMVVAWLTARILFLGFGAGWLSWGADALFVVVTIVPLLRRFLVAVRKWRNQATSLALAGLGLLIVSWPLFAGHTNNLNGLAAAREGVLLFALLLSFMGGRILAALVAVPLQRKKRFLADRVQQRVEAVQLISVALALTLQWFSTAQWLTAGLLVTAGSAGLVRLYRWRWAFGAGQADLNMLATGYFWLAGGLVTMGWSFLLGADAQAALLHSVAVGALGTLGLVQMVRVSQQRMDRQLSLPASIWVALCLVWASAILRTLSGVAPELTVSIWMCAAIGWGLAFGACLVHLLRTEFIERRQGQVVAIQGSER